MFKKLFDKTLIKFAIVGVINTIFGMSIMFAFYNLLHFSYWISTASNYIFGSILSYFLNKYFTFQNKERSLKIVLKFIINIAICYSAAYGLAQLAAVFLVKDMSKAVQDNVAMIFGSGLFVVLNYFGQKFFAFKEK